MSRHLLIGGIDLVIDAGPVTRLEQQDPFSRRFLHDDPHGEEVPGQLQVPLSFSLEPGPDTGQLPLLFDTGASWAAFAGEEPDDVVLELRAPGGGHLWRALLREGSPRATVYCGPGLVSRPEPGVVVLTSPLHYPLDQLLLVYLLAPRQGLVVHAAGVALGGHGLILAGPSGAGKTTVMRLLAGCAALTGLSDDRVVVRNVAGRTLVYGTPWAGEGQVAGSEHAPLEAILLLHKAEVDELRPITARQAVQQLLRTSSILWYDQDRLARQTSFLDQLLRDVPAYELHFTPTALATDTILQLLR